MKKRFTLSAIVLFVFSFGLFAQIPLSEELVVVSNEMGVNSEELEFSPVFYKDGIVFISTRHESLIFNVKDKNIGGKNIMSIYKAQRNSEGFLSAPEPFADELIFRLHEGPVTFDHAGNAIFFTRNEHEELAPDGFKKLQIYTSTKEGEGWGQVQKLSFNNVNFNYCHPTISPDEDVLFISSDVPGGYGGMDIYAVHKADGKWSQMVNLGDRVNTPGNEVFPHIAADGALYFSSDGHGGLGNLDLFYALERGEEWGSPVNLGSPFNSPVDDFGFIVDRDNKNGYFSSDREGGFGGDDIYKFYIETQGDSPLADLSGKNLDGLVILDEEGNPMEGVQISAINFSDIPLSASDGQMVNLRSGIDNNNFILDVNTDGLGETVTTGVNGSADLPLRRGEYVLKVTKEGHLPQYVVVTPETELDNLQITLNEAVDCIMLTGKVMMQEMNSPMSGAIVKIIDVDTEEVVTVYSDGAGVYEYCIDCKKTYSVYTEKNNSRSAPSIVSTKNMPCSATNSRIDLPLYLDGSPIYAGMTIRLPNIYFNFDDASLRPDAYQDLNEVVGMLNQVAGLKIELGSHTDSRGGKTYNKNLSQRRSQSVMEYLIGKGIDRSRLQPMGYGESQIRNKCEGGVACTEAEHQYNRRTEIKILELGDASPIAIAEGSSDRKDYIEAISYGPDSNKGGQSAETYSSIENTSETQNKKNLPVKVRNRSAANKDYVVVAGTFSNHDYAFRRVSLLLEKGFLESSIVRQERSGLYAVYVQTYNSKKDAFQAIKDLDRKQIHAYVMGR